MADPIIKWVGGKRQLLPVIEALMPRHYGTYFEPFLGGGAVYLAVNPPKAVLNDCNPQLIGMYTAVRNTPEQVEAALRRYQDTYNSGTSDRERTGYYFALRDRFNAKIREHQNDPDMAALLIFLNKAGFNGLYRMSKAGRYNVPPAHKASVNAYSPDNLRAVSVMLKGAGLLCGDFESAVSSARAGDFVFFDSPYADTFDAYQAGGFSEADHRRLASLFADLTGRGVSCLLANSNTALIRELYQDYEIRTVPVKRMVNRNASGRTGEEVIITNYRTGGGV